LSIVLFIGPGVEGLGGGRVVGDEERQPPAAIREELLVLTLKVLSPLHGRWEGKEHILISLYTMILAVDGSYEKY
jgi:hypothetical protein